MTFRINANSCKNAVGTVFLLATAFFVCSTLISMRSVLADPIVDTNAAIQKSGRQSPRTSTNSRANVARTTTAQRTNVGGNKSAVSRAAVNRTTTRTPSRVSSRSITPQRTTNARSVAARTQNANRTTTNNRVVRARSGAAQSRVSATGTVMSGSRAGSSTSYTYLSSRLYTGSYSNIIDSSTGLISADAYSNCMESYYTCMDEICTARSDTKGRCSCAGRATNFLEAEEQLEAANEELIKLSGQLSLLIATKGEGKDLASAFSLTDAEQVMNCVSYRENVQAGKMTDTEWYEEHPTVDASGTKKTSGMPSYCTNNNYGFDIKDIDGSSSDILAQLQAWADAKDLAKQYSSEDNNTLVSNMNRLAGVVNNLSNITTAVETTSIDTLANKWGYKLFEYAHNNVCGRVLDSCFNGIYEACGTPPSVTDSDNKTHNKCANGASSACPFNYNSYISVVTSGDNAGDVKLNERGSNSASSTSSASCFGYTTTSSLTGTRTTTATSDPYYTLRGPVADARRSIMQKYLLDANSACDTYGAALKQTAQNINYQKIAAEQALQQKRLEFKQEKEAKVLADATTAATNFDECLSELIDCYETQSDNTTSGGAKWTEARVKTYCAQISQVPHCYETMICNPSTAQFHAVIELPDNTNCFNSQDYTQNTCRNIVTISEILYGASSTYGNIGPEKYGSSVDMREQCLRDAGVNSIRSWTRQVSQYTECSLEELREKDSNATAGYKNSDSGVCEYITQCNSGYMLSNNECVARTTDCTSEIVGAASAIRTLSNGVWSSCTLQSCKVNYTKSGNTCVADTINCSQSVLNAANATDGTQTWNGTAWSSCVFSACAQGYELSENSCVRTE